MVHCRQCVPCGALCGAVWKVPCSGEEHTSVMSAYGHARAHFAIRSVHWLLRVVRGVRDLEWVGVVLALGRSAVLSCCGVVRLLAARRLAWGFEFVV